MQLKLKVLEGNQSGSEIAVPGPKFFVGRDPDCHLRPGSDLVSRHHCVLLVEQGYVAVRDFGSKNGTFVNGERITGEHPLSQDDELVIGPLRFSVQLIHKLGGPKRSKVHSVKEAAERTAELAADADPDISDWLEDDEQEAATAESQAMARKNTDRKYRPDDVPAGDTSEIKLSDPDSADASESSDAKNGKAKEQSETAAGKLPHFTVAPEQDTHTAATRVLREFARQRAEEKQAKKGR